MMNLVQSATAALHVLKDQLAQIEPSAQMVSHATLRRIVKEHRHMNGFSLGLPLRSGYLLPLEDYCAIEDEPVKHRDSLSPEWKLLLPEPTYRQRTNWPLRELQRLVWRQLFFLRLQRQLLLSLQQGQLTEQALCERQHRIGWVAYDEIRQVLIRDRYVLPPWNETELWITFVSLFWELHFFQPDALPVWFPSFTIDQTLIDWMRQDIDVESVWQASRLGELHELQLPTASVEAEAHDIDDTRKAATRPPASESIKLTIRWDRQWLLRLADYARSKGNYVRSAILRVRLARNVPEAAEVLQAQAHDDLDQMLSQLQQCLESPASTLALWRLVLHQLLAPASHGLWPVAARFLYDLQKVYLDLSKPLFTTDLIVWIRTLGQQPIRRPLPHVPRALALRHLRRVLKRLPSLSLALPIHNELKKVVESCIEDQESKLRQQLKPVLTEALQGGGLVPQNRPEQIGLAKIVAGLSDHIVDRGRCTFSQLRDTLSGNQLKLNDLISPMEFIKGDALLKTDRQLAFAVDGLYRPGEFYLRWFQSLSSLAFGTKSGRFLTRYLAIPFGSAFCILEFALHFLNPLLKHLPPDALKFAFWWSVLGLGLYLMGLIYVPLVQQVSLRVVHKLGQLLQLVFIRLPRWMVDLPPIKRFLNLRSVQWCTRHLVSPLLVMMLTALLLYLWGFSEWTTWSYSLAIFGLHLGLKLTKPGREWLDSGTDALLLVWERIRFDFIPGLFRWIMDFFQTLVHSIERLLYSVDEWLRFRGGENSVSIVCKTLIGVIWFCITYVLRFAINLLIEPQINPLKHFPVVTVSHKLLLPTIPHVAQLLEKVSPGYSVVEYQAYATSLVSGIPGIFGFLVWELKENWKLYAANRADTIRPMIIGHHGETMSRLFRPGFHSGTIPKIFAKWRHATRRYAMRTGTKALAARHRLSLEHVQHDLDHFFYREGLAYFQPDFGWSIGPVRLQQLLVATNRCDVYFICEGHEDARPLHLALWEQHRRLIGQVVDLGWQSSLAEHDQEHVRMVCLGLMAQAGVNVLLLDELQQRDSRPEWQEQPVELMFRSEGPTLIATDHWTLLKSMPWPECKHVQLKRQNRDLSYQRFELTWEEWLRFWSNR